MKRLLTLLISLALCLMLIGCASGRNKGDAGQKKTNGTSFGPADLSIPDAEEFDVIAWPTFGIALKIPMPTWSDRGRFYSSEDSETTLWMEIGYTTVDDYRNYVKALQDYGYNLNIHEETDCKFWGENEEGYGVQLTYISWSHYMGLQVTSDATEWDGWWKN